jgi:hypothetical protein
MWGLYRPYRAAFFRLALLLTFRSATQNQSLIEALHSIQRYQHARHDTVPAEVSLDIASVRWQALVKTRQHLRPVLHRRQLEVCVFRYLDHGLRYGDVYVEGSEAYADYRQQLLPWQECLPRVSRRTAQTSPKCPGSSSFLILLAKSHRVTLRRHPPSAARTA